MRVEMALPISWYRPCDTAGPNMTNTNRVGIGTSVRSPMTQLLERRMNAAIGFSRKSTSPTKTFDASAFDGSRFKKPGV